MKRELIIFLAVFVLSLTLVYAAGGFDLKGCKNDCRAVQKSELGLCKENYNECKSECSDRDCRAACSQTRSTCLKDANAAYKSCKDGCVAESMPKCLDGNYSYGETFAQGCDICECKARGKVNCKKEAFCNLNVTVDEGECAESGGFYQALCNGPYFGIVCSQQEFCLCGGNANFSCPAEHSCLKDFVSPNKRTSVVGWKTLRGELLGDVGVCGI